MAAGKGSRMDLDIPKPLIPLLRKPMIERIIEALSFPMITDICIIVGYESDKIRSFLDRDFIYFYQDKLKGTAHAVQRANSIFLEYDNVFILPSDSPSIKQKTLHNLYQSHQAQDADCSFLTSQFPFVLPYARIIRNNGEIVACIEDVDANEEQKEIRELFTSHYLFKSYILDTYLNKIKIHPRTNEYHLTDIINIMLKCECDINAVRIEEYQQLMGINTKEELKFMESWLASDVK